MEKHSRFLALALSLALAASLLPASALAEGAASNTPAVAGTETVAEQQTGNTQSGTDNSEKAEENSSSVVEPAPAAANAALAEGSETAPAAITDVATFKKAVANGGEVKLGGNITLNSTLEIGTNTTIDTNGSTLTIEPTAKYYGITIGTTAKLTLCDTSSKGTGTLLISEANNGIWSNGGSLSLNNVSVKIQNTTGYGIYDVTQNNSSFDMTGGSLEIKDCGQSSKEGGIDWDSGNMAFNSGNVSITGCGYDNFGAIYSGADIVFGNGTDSLTVNLENNSLASDVKNTIVLVGGKNLTINKNATVNIAIAGIGQECRGINIGSSNSTVSVNGELNISKDDSCKAATVYGIRGSDAYTPALKVNQGGIVNIAGYSKPENALHNVRVTMNGGSMDLGGKFDAASAAPSATLRLDADAALNETLTTAADTTIDTNGFTLTIEPEADKNSIYIDSCSLTMKGNYHFIGGYDGIKLYESNDASEGLTLESANVTIEGANEFGIYTLTEPATFSMTSSTLNIKNCGVPGKGGEGGIEWDGGSMTFNSGNVNITDCGKAFYAAATDVIFGDGTQAMTVTCKDAVRESAAGENESAVVITKKLTVNKLAVLNITLTGSGAAQRRGINGAASSNVDINGGTVNINSEYTGTGTTYGTRGENVSVENGGTLSISGVSSGIAVKNIDSTNYGSLTVKNDSTVSITGTSKPTDGIPVTIDGGSMNLGTGTDGKAVADAAAAGATSIKNSLGDDVPLQIIDARTFTAKVSNATDSYNYSAKSDGKIYAWLPANRVSFYDSDKTTCLGGSAKSGDATWADLKAGAPSMSGKTNFSKWVDVDGKDIADSTSVKGELKVYAVYTTPAPYVPSGPSYVGPVSTPTDSGTTITDPDVPQAALPSALNSTVHFAYVTGYSDGTVRPAANITRAEVATMFYRLLTAERRDAIFTAKGSFTDVNSEDWYNKAVSSMANGKYITGYTSSIFGGDRAITRAEFVAIASRFMDAKGSTKTFSDVPASFWAADYISTAVAYGWIDGYPDGSFKPNQPITRAEAIKIINTMLGRGTDAAGVMTGLKTWSDNADAGAWYYYDIVEATNDHTFTGARPSEKWTGLKLDYSYDQAKYETPDTSK